VRSQKHSARFTIPPTKIDPENLPSTTGSVCMGGRLTKNITVPKNMGGNVYCIFPEKCKNLRTSRVNQMFGDVLLSYLEINDLMVCLAIGYPKICSSYACAITMTILQYTPFSILLLLLFIIVIELYNLTSYNWLVVCLPL